MDNMDNDDRQLGRILGRREVLALFGATGAAGAAILAGAGGRLVPSAAAQVPACVVRPEVTEGPYYVADPGFNTTGQQFLRGAQVTDANGTAMFTTIYPGWYASRAVHIHFKVRPDANSVFTSQLFFDDALTDQVFAQAPYASKGRRDTLNRTDTIYQDLLLLTVTQTAQGYAATFPIGVDLSTLGTQPARATPDVLLFGVVIAYDCGAGESLAER